MPAGTWQAGRPRFRAGPLPRPLPSGRSLDGPLCGVLLCPAPLGAAVPLLAFVRGLCLPPLPLARPFPEMRRPWTAGRPLVGAGPFLPAGPPSGYLLLGPPAGLPAGREGRPVGLKPPPPAGGSWPPGWSGWSWAAPGWPWPMPSPPQPPAGQPAARKAPAEPAGKPGWTPAEWAGPPKARPAVPTGPEAPPAAKPAAPYPPRLPGPQGSRPQPGASGSAPLFPLGRRCPQAGLGTRPPGRAGPPGPG